MGPGKPGAVKLRVNPKFSARVRASHTPLYKLGRLAGWSHGREASYFTQSGTVVPATALMRSRLAVLASLVGFPPDEIFLEDQA